MDGFRGRFHHHRGTMLSHRYAMVCLRRRAGRLADVRRSFLCLLLHHPMAVRRARHTHMDARCAVCREVMHDAKCFLAFRKSVRSGRIGNLYCRNHTFADSLRGVEQKHWSSCFGQTRRRFFPDSNPSGGKDFHRTRRHLQASYWPILLQPFPGSLSLIHPCLVSIRSSGHCTPVDNLRESNNHRGSNSIRTGTWPDTRNRRKDSYRSADSYHNILRNSNPIRTMDLHRPC